MISKETVEIIDMNSGEVITCRTMYDALRTILASRIIGGKWCLNSKVPGNIPCIERHIKHIAKDQYISYESIPPAFSSAEDIASDADIGF